MHALPLRPCNAFSSFEAFYMHLEPNCVTVSAEPLKQGIACICQQNRRCTPKRVLLCSDVYMCSFVKAYLFSPVACRYFPSMEVS